MCKSLEPPIISLYFAAKDPDSLVSLSSAVQSLEQHFPRLSEGLAKFFIEHSLLVNLLLVQFLYLYLYLITVRGIVFF